MYMSDRFERGGGGLYCAESKSMKSLPELTLVRICLECLLFICVTDLKCVCVCVVGVCVCGGGVCVCWGRGVCTVLRIKA